MDNWIESKIIFAKDLYDDKGNFITVTVLKNCREKRTEFVSLQLFMLYLKHMISYLIVLNQNIVTVSCLVFFSLNRMKYGINLLNTKLFHSIYVNKNSVKPISERSWCKKFNIEYEF